MSDITQIKTQLASRAESIVRELLPNGAKHGNEWCAGSTGGEKGQSLKVRLNGDKAGIWNDFATGQGGDLLDLFCAVKGADLATALRWAKEMLGIREPQFHKTTETKPYRRPEKPKNLTAPKSAALDYLTIQRGLKPETLKAFQIGEQAAHSFRTKAGSHTCPAVVFPFKVGDELFFVKYLGTERPDGKKLIDAEAGCEPVLFGWQAFPLNQRTALICEGEVNAMSWHQFGVSALATPFGAGKGNKHAWIASEWERLEQFEIIYLNFDPDAAGKEAIADLVQRLGRHRCRVVPAMPDGHKDANDCLFAGVSAETMRALLDGAKTLDPEELRSAADFENEVLALFNGEDVEAQGVPMPFESARGKFAFRPGETTILTGKRGEGKTEAINWITSCGMIQQGQRVLIASFEMKAKKLLQRAVRQITAQKDPSNEYVRQVMRWYYDKLWIFDHVGNISDDRIFEVFDYARRRYGITMFVIDSLMMCDVRGVDQFATMAAESAFTKRLVNFNAEHNTHGILVAHGKKSEAGSMPDNDDVRGNGQITDLAHNVISVWRNKAKEIALAKQMSLEPMDRDEQNALNKPDAIWAVRKQREGDGWIGHINLGFDPDSKQFVGEGETVRPLLPFREPQGVAYVNHHQFTEDEYPVF